MIEPFEPTQIKQINGRPVVSFGTSSYGYDIRCSDEFKLFTDINTTIVDPKNFDPKSFVDVKGDFCIIPPNSFALARTVEYLRVPRNVLVLCLGKSTYARCFRGDTRVALVDGTAPTLEEMARRAQAGDLLDLARLERLDHAVLLRHAADPPVGFDGHLFSPGTDTAQRQAPCTSDSSACLAHVFLITILGNAAL